MYIIQCLVISQSVWTKKPRTVSQQKKKYGGGADSVAEAGEDGGLGGPSAKKIHLYLSPLSRGVFLGMVSMAQRQLRHKGFNML